MARILIIEDNADIAESMRHGLEQSGFSVEMAGNAGSGLKLARLTSPDMVLLEVALPDMDGIAVCRQLRASGNVGIVIVTARNLVEDRVLGLEAGADDYLTKPFAFEELVARVRSVLRRQKKLNDKLVRAGDLEIDVERRQVSRGPRPIDLTTREFDLLKLLAENAGRPLRRESILHQVWGEEFESNTDPVKVYVAFLRRKLNAAGEPDLIQAVRGFGYVLRKA